MQTPNPVVIPSTCSYDTLLLWSSLPEFARDQDAAGDSTNGPYQFLNWLEGAVAGGSPNNTSASGLQDLDDLCRDDQYALGWSPIMDVTRCPVYALPWLGQFVGVRFDGATVGNENAMRLAILTKANFNRGTPSAIAASLAPYLGANGFVRIIERSPDAYSFIVQVYGDLAALTYSQLAAEQVTYNAVAAAYPFYNKMGNSQHTSTVIAAVQNATPGGLNVTVQFM